MRKPAARKVPSVPRKPNYFPPENVLTRAVPPALAGQREFEEYRFVGIDFSGADWRGWRFTECAFEDCNLTGATLTNTAFQNVAFTGCKLLGLPLHPCRELLFAVHFEGCQLDYASFCGRKLPGTRFAGCSLVEADFTQADLSGAVFDDCQLRRAIFHETRLAGADFATAHDVTLDPAFNDVKQARFALRSLPGLLAQFDIVVADGGE